MMSEGQAPPPPTGTYTSPDPNVLIGRLSAKNKEFRIQRDQANEQVADMKKQLTTLEKERDNAPAIKRVKELEHELRSIKHRAVFNRIAKEKGVLEDGLDDLYSLSGYNPEGDVVDEPAVTALIDEQKGKRAYLFAPAEPPFDPSAPFSRVKPGPASGQGSRPGGGTTGFDLPGDDDPRWSDSRWQWDHRVEIADAINNRLKNGVV